MPLPMPEEEEKFRCPHGERNQALMLCSLDCDLSGAHPDRKAKGGWSIHHHAVVVHEQVQMAA